MKWSLSKVVLNKIHIVIKQNTDIYLIVINILLLGLVVSIVSKTKYKKMKTRSMIKHQ